MTWEIWLLFVATETALCVTPGPAALLTVSQGLARGTLASIWSNLGILAANSFYFLLSATSLGAVLLASYELFFLIKWIGAAYLVWLGITAFFGRSPVLSARPAADKGEGAWRMILNGFFLQAANPKSLLFFTALLPQFVDPAGDIAVQVVILAITSIVIEFFVLLGYGAAAGRMTRIATEPHFARLTNRVAGTLLISAGVSMAAIRRS